MIVLAPSAAANTRDFKTYDAYLNDLGVVFYEGEQQATVSGALNATRQDTGTNPNEIRPDFGHFFAQGDFRNGQGQVKFHLGEGRSDPLKYLYGEGIDVSEEGRVALLKDVSQNADSDFASPTMMTIADGELWVALSGSNTLLHAATPASNFTSESHGQTGNIHCMTSSGSNLFVSFDTDGIEYRNASGTWAAWGGGAPAMETMGWVKDRLVGVHTTDGTVREMTSSASTTIDTLADGWEGTSVFELGGFVYITVVNTGNYRSQIRCYGIADGDTTLSLKHSTDLPQGQLAHCGLGYLGQAFIGGLVKGETWDRPIMYQSISVDGEGRLTLAKLAEGGDDNEADTTCTAITAFGESVIFGWSEEGDAPFGARTGLMRYDLARGALSHFYSYDGGTPPVKVEDVVVFFDKVIWITQSDDLLYNSGTVYRSTGTLITSVADWNNAGLKVWDRIEITHDPMPAGASIAVYYTTSHPEEDDWILAGTSSTAGSEGAVFNLTDPIVESRTFTLKFILTRATDTTLTPVLRGYSVRSNPKTTEEEWELTRHLWVAPKFKARSTSQVKQQDVRSVLTTLRDSLRDWVTFYEPDATWTMFVEQIAEVEPVQARHQATQGSPSKEGFIVSLKMRGTRA